MATDPYTAIYQARRVAPREKPRGLSLVDQTIMDDRDEQLRSNVAESPAPDQVARQTRVAREAGIEPAMVEDVDGAERSLTANRTVKVFGQYPALGRWAAANPRGAVTAQDDHESLGMLGRAWEGVKNVGHRLTAGAYESGAGLLANDDIFDGALGTVNPVVKAAFDLTTGLRGTAAQTMRDTASSQREQGRAKNWWADTALSGMESIPISIAAVMTRNPTMAAAIPALSIRGSSLAEAKRQGLTGSKANAYSILQGGTEFLTEKIPAGRLVNDLLKGTGIGKTIVRQLATELPGEQVATAVQDFVDWAMLPENDTKTLGEYVAARPGAALQTAVATVAGTTAQTSIAVATDRSVRAAVKLTDRVAQASQARQEAKAIDALGKGAEKSKLRQPNRDPEAFRSAMQESANDAGIENLHISGEALAAYMQSDAYDPDSDPFARYADQVSEAAATGGDVVIPIADALTDLVGSKAWEALKPDMRLTPGGQSPREADTFDAAMEDIMADLTDEMAAREKGDLAERDTRTKLVDALAVKFQDAGIATAQARNIAEFAAQRAVTRMEQRGWDITGHEFDNLTVRSVLPESAKPFVKREGEAVTVDPELVKAIKAKRGPSLLDFIAKRGGINDPGGDLASMGIGKAKGVAKKGQRKIIRDFDPAAGVDGSGDYGIDNVMLAAIDAGYFPDLVGLQQGEGTVELDTNVLIEAMDAELGGKPRYAKDAAGDVRAMLEQSGYDPAKMSAGDIRDALAQMFEQDARDGLAQLPATLDIDGVQRSTTNSEGQPLAGTEEGVRAFYKWFADSKVVDKDGRPLVVYHGTKKGGFASFDVDGKGKTSETGAFFTNTKMGAFTYSGSQKDVGPRPSPDDVVANPGAFQWAIEETGDGSWKMTDPAGQSWVEETKFRDAAIEDYYREEDAGIYSTYLALEDPFIVDFNGANWDSRGGDEWFVENEDGDGLEYFTDKESLDDFVADWDEEADGPLKVIESHDNPERESTDDIARQARQNGDDGVIFDNITDEGPHGQGYGWSDRVFVAFKPEQIKSVNNRGTFDPNDARILYQDLFDAENATDPAKAEAAKERLKLRAEAPLRGENKTGKAQDGSMGLGLFDAANQGSLFQSYDKDARGRIIFDQGKAIIELFQSRNKSTVLHELGHLWLEELRFDAAQSDATPQLKADWQTVQDWFAANNHPMNPDGSIPVEAHELWARSHERYLMEGKSPVAALKRIFETFRGWLTGIYKTVDALKAPISPEIREVFDRLIATDEEIADANERQNLAALFKSAADQAMTAQEFEAYQRQVTDARAEAQGKLLDKTMRSVRAKATKAWNDEAATVREQVTAEVNDLPLFRALRAMKTDRISEEWVKAEGFDTAALPVRVPPLTKPGGADPELVAEMAGFATAGDMLRTLIEAESGQRQAKEGGDPRSLRVRVIETSVEAEMTRRHGDALNDGSIEREALEAVHNDMQGEVIATELRVLSRKSGKRATPYALAKDWARNRVRSGKVVDEASPAAIQRYARAAAKAGKAAQDAMLKGDADETFRQKQFQLLNNALVSEAKSAHDEVQAAVKRLARVAKARTMKSVDQDYLEQAQALLEAVDIRPRSQVGIDKQGSWEAWSAQRTAEGFDIVVPGSFEATLGKTNWSRLPVEDLLSLDEAVKQAIHLGRFKQTMLDNKERREFDEVVGEAIVTTLGGMDRKPPSDLMEPSFWDRAKSRVAAIDSALLKMETVFDWLDLGNSNGVFNRVVFRPIAEAQHNASERMAGLAEKLNDALEAVPAQTRKRWRNRVTTELLNRDTGNPFVFTRDQLVSIALNMGNRGNIDKLTGGYGWDEATVRDVLNRELTAEEWTYVQSVWDTIDSLWPDIEAMEKRLNGVAPEKVEAIPVDTPAGQLRGGYFPVVYDPRRNYDSEANAAKGRDLFEAIYTRSTTPKGFTKERTKVERPIHLSLGIISRHVAEVVHDITHREAIMQADKFLADKRIMAAVDETLGPEVRQQFRPWLQRIANQWAYDRAGLAGAEGFLRKMRTNTTIVGMGFRVSTMMMQAAGFSNSFEVVGAKWMTPAIARAAAHPVEAFNFVMERSGEVPNRMANLDRDIKDAARAAGGFEKLTAVKRYAFHGIGYMDRLVVIPTWLGAYDKAIAGGMAEAEAIYAAEKAVRQSQGSGAAKDLAAIQSGRGTAGEAFKFLTMFYSYMSAFYQRERTLGRDVAGAGLKDVPKLLARAWWLIILPPLLAEILAGRGPGDDDDDETWASWAFEAMTTQLLGPIPLVRDVAPVLFREFKDQPSFGYRFTPAQGGIESIVRLGKEVERVADGKETRQLTRTSVEAVGYFTGLTTGQMAAAAQFLVDVGMDEADPEGLGQWYEGLVNGKIKEDN